MRRALPIFWLIAASSALAQEKSAPPPDISIDSATREFNALKAARNSLDVPAKLDLPSVATPELSTGAPQPLPSLSKPDPATTKKQSANWLVDAMMKPAETDARDPRAKNSDLVGSERSNTAILDREGRGLVADAESPLPTTRDKKAPPAAEKKTGPEFNPLMNYMAGWMTSQDYALLKPGLDSVVSSRMANSPIVQASSGGVGEFTAMGNLGGAGGVDFGATGKPAALALPKPADNPFLQSFATVAAPVASFTPPSAAAPANPAPSAVVPQPLELPATRSKIPDFAKPAADEKYFKQLKRF